MLKRQSDSAVRPGSAGQRVRRARPGSGAGALAEKQRGNSDGGRPGDLESKLKASSGGQLRNNGRAIGGFAGCPQKGRARRCKTVAEQRARSFARICHGLDGRSQPGCGEDATGGHCRAEVRQRVRPLPGYGRETAAGAFDKHRREQRPGPGLRSQAAVRHVRQACKTGGKQAGQGRQGATRGRVRC